MLQKTKCKECTEKCFVKHGFENFREKIDKITKKNFRKICFNFSKKLNFYIWGDKFLKTHENSEKYTNIIFKNCTFKKINEQIFQKF